jgi:hypothetical protein
MLRTRTLLLVQVAVAALVIAGGKSAAADTAAKATTIATATSLDYRVDVTARKISGGNAPTAEIIVTNYQRSNGHWRPAGTSQIPGIYFWKTVSAPHSLCRLEIDTARAPAAGVPRAIVQVLVSPSIGCGRTQTIPLSG